MYLFEKFFEKISQKKYSFSQLFIMAAAAASFGISGAFMILPKQTDTISVSITAILLADVFEKLLEANKNNIWKHGVSSGKANRLLAMQFLTIFVAIMFVYFAAGILMPLEEIQYIFGSQFKYAPLFSGSPPLAVILKSKFWTLFLCLVAALTFMRRGAGLVLSWFAAVWGIMLLLVFRFQSVGTELSIAPVLSSFSYLLLELTGYILIVMAGIFAMKALRKYSLTSKAFKQVMFAVLKISLFAVLFVLLSAFLQVGLTQFY